MIGLGAILPFFSYYVVLPGLLSTFLHQIILRSSNFIGFFLIFSFHHLHCRFFLIKRLWCNLICPTGILLQIFTWKMSLRVVKASGIECKKCALCSFECPLGLTSHLNTHQPLCYNCGKCVVACQSIKKDKNPLKFKIF